MDKQTRKTLMSSADTGGRDDHNTPEAVLLPVYQVLSHVDLDPCSNSNSRVLCAEAFDFHGRGEDGLKLPWRYRADMRRADGTLWPSNVRHTAFVNPPYGKGAGPAWARKIGQEVEAGLEVIALVPARTDTAAFQEVYLQADAICFWAGRIKFEIDGAAQDPAPFPSAVVYFGPHAAQFRKVFGSLGVVR